MANKKEEKVVEEVQPTETKAKEVKEQVESEGGNMKAPAKKKATKPKKLTSQEPTISKVDLSEKKEEQPKDDVAKVDLSKKEEPVEQVKEEVTPEETTEVEDTPVVEEITDEEVVEQKVEETKEEVVEAIEEAKQTGEPLPENIQKVVDFMSETGGSLEEYVRLNQDYNNYDENQLLREYYKQTKPHLTDDEISFVMEDRFSYNEEVDEEKDVRRKKLALKEQVADAKNHLEGLKSKYYAEIKSGVKLTSDQQKAVDFFNRYNKEQEGVQQRSDVFNKKTNEVFTDQFKGFEYSIGEKRFRFNVKDVDKVKNNQSNINNFVKPFLNKNNEMDNAKAYHKSLFTAMNADAAANHFYQQGSRCYERKCCQGEKCKYGPKTTVYWTS